MAICAGGAGNILRIVDRIDENPTTLLDLNSEPLFFSNFNAPPVLNTAGPVYFGFDETRTVEFDLSIDPSTIQQGAQALQELFRLLSKSDQWLMFQKVGAPTPVFFLLRRFEVSSVNDWLMLPGQRLIHLALPADVTSYGLPVEFEVTVLNNPAATGSVNPMRFSVADVQGDVATPLSMTFDVPDDDLATFWTSISTYGTADPDTGPYFKAFADQTLNTGSDLWEVTTTADSTMISGTRVRLSQVDLGAVMFNPFEDVTLTWDDLPPGEYRVFVRARPGVSYNYQGTVLSFYNNAPDDGPITGYVEGEAAASASLVEGETIGTIEWFDLGVVAMPDAAPLADVIYNSQRSLGEALWSFTVTNVLADDLAIIDLDVLALVPAGRPGTLVQQGSAQFDARFTDREVTIDGTTGQWFATGVSTGLLPGGERAMARPETFFGAAAPVLVPGAENHVYFMVSTSTFSAKAVNVLEWASRADDSKSTETTIESSYFPRYVLDRPEDS